ncbi:MAG: aldehyde ferredoxin oxidoreductase C-terminal domain-containing protein [Candidatus Bathyarchaeia archaeon]
MNGYAGKILRIDLTKQEVSAEVLEESVAKKWIGGAGLGSYYLYKEVPFDVRWDEPENEVIISSGPLGGTKVAGSGTICACTKGAMTGGATSTQANGFLGAYLRSCGYDAIVIKGSSPDWVYLYVSEQEICLRPATHLKGLDTWKIQKTLRDEVGRKPVSIFSIGPAGENLVRFAALVGDYGHVAAHNGVGAVLGAKKLKAIVVARGKKKIPLYHERKLGDLSRNLAEISKKLGTGPSIYAWGTNDAFSVLPRVGALPVKNYLVNVFPESDKFTGQYIRTNFQVRKATCWACTWAHCRMIKIKEGPFSGFEGREPEYEAMAAMGPVIGQTDPAAAIFLANLVDRLGMDINETGWVIGWVMECYEKGYLKRGDLDGLDMRWGNVDATKTLIEKIAFREGVGSLLADGVKRASERIGGPAYSCAIFTLKGNTPRGHDHRAMWTELIDTCFSSTGTIETSGGSIPVEQHGLKPITNPFDWEQVVNQNAKTSGRRIFQDSLVVCRFPNEDFGLLVDCVNAATGWALTPEEAISCGRRVINLLRVFNYRCGIGKELEAPSPRYGSAPEEGPARGMSIISHWEQVRRRYYELMGWDPDSGYPLPETLRMLGLSEIIEPVKKG